MKKKVGLYFGSFNPIHIGHMAIANYFVEFTEIDQLWFVVSPQNPLKNKATLLNDYQRLELVHLAIGDSDLFKASNIEFTLPKPSYTIDTLTYLSEKYVDIEFLPIMGSDSLESLNKWKNFELLLKNYTVLVYPRPDTQRTPFHDHPSIKLVDAPMIEISSSFIREAIKEGKNIKYFMPQSVYNYIDDMNFYR